MNKPSVMLVTGGSRGIGAGIAKHAAAKGYKVCVNYTVTKDRADALVNEIRQSGGTAIAVQGDVRQYDDVVRLFKTARDELGPVDCLVNNAGVSILNPITEMPLETIRQIVDTNYLGTIHCTREAIQHMSKEDGGTGGVILNISSIAAVYGGMPGDVIYAGTKGAIDSFTLGIAKEVAGKGIRVCGLRPGITRTEIWEGELDADEVTALGQKAVPLGRIGEVADVAAAALWLCSSEADYITGEILNVSGGREIFVRGTS